MFNIRCVFLPKKFWILFFQRRSLIPQCRIFIWPERSHRVLTPSVAAAIRCTGRSLNNKMLVLVDLCISHDARPSGNRTCNSSGSRGCSSSLIFVIFVSSVAHRIEAIRSLQKSPNFCFSDDEMLCNESSSQLQSQSVSVNFILRLRFLVAAKLAAASYPNKLGLLTWPPNWPDVRCMSCNEILTRFNQKALAI